MKIIHIIDYFHPQLGYQETYLALEHQKAGHDVHVITSNQVSPAVINVVDPHTSLAKTDREFPFTVHRLRMAIEYRTRVWLIDLEKKVYELNPDLIIVHGMSSFTSLRIALIKNKIKKVKIIYDFHSNYVNSQHPLRKHFYTLYRHSISKIFQKSADAIVAVDNNSEKFLIDECGYSPDSIHIIPLGADLHTFRFDDESRAEIRRELDLEPSNIVCVFSGRLTRSKGIHLLIEAGISILRHDQRLRILIIGNGDADYINEMKETVRQSTQEYGFFWIDFLTSSNLAKYYSASDIAIWPQQVSIGTLEAQSCGLPLIVADTPMLRDRVSQGNGLVFTPNSAESLQQKLQHLIDNEAYRKHLGRVGRRVVESEYNWKNIAKSFIELTI